MGETPLTELQVLGFEMRALGARMDAGFAQVDSRFAQIDSRFAQVDAQFAQIGMQFTGLTLSTTGAIAELRRDLSQRIDAVDRKVETVIDSLADFRNEYQQHTHE